MPEHYPTNSVEIWKPIPGFEGVYDVSDHGQVRRVKQSKGTQAGRILKLSDGVGGKSKGHYYSVALSVNNRARQYLVHTLVMSAFIGPRAAGYEINHKDGNGLNNRVDNLEYVTHTQNMRHCALMRRHHHGEGHSEAVLNEAKVKLIRELHAEGWPRSVLAAIFGVSPKAVENARKGKTWKHVGNGLAMNY